MRKLLCACGLLDEKAEAFLSGAGFAPQDDGGMGSFSVTHGGRRIGVRDCSEARYVDEDGIEVVIALIVDAEDKPSDVDFWKADSRPLVRFPDADQLVVSRIESRNRD